MIEDKIYAEYLKALIAGRRQACTNIVQSLLADGVSIPDLYAQLFQRSMVEIGERWERHEISVAVEHLATSITENLMSLTYPLLFEHPETHKSAVVSCAANEFHQIGGRMVADILEMHGWSAFFLGANTPVEDLMDMIHRKTPDLVALSLSVYFNMPSLIRSVERIRASHPDLPILIGGQAFRWGGCEQIARFDNVKYVPDLSTLERIADSAP